MQNELPENWKSLLLRCNFALARRELGTFFQIATQEADSRGQEVFYRTEFVNGWDRFRDNPCFEMAVAFLENAPDYAENMFGYFMECCPGGRFALYDSLIPERNNDPEPAIEFKGRRRPTPKLD
jgi:hypothetical protein